MLTIRPTFGNVVYTATIVISMRRLKSIDEIYGEVRSYDLVITNDVALETALNSRIDTLHMGTFAITPRHLAGEMSHEVLGSAELNDLELIARVSKDTELDFKYVYSEILNFREIRRYTADVRKHITSKRSMRVYDAYCTLATRERVMDKVDPFEHMPRAMEGKRVALVGIEFFDDLDKHFTPPDCDYIDIFTNEEYSIPEIREVGNDRQLAENAVDLIDPNHPDDFAIVLRASSPIADAVRAALYRKELPFVNALPIRDMVYIRDYLGFLSNAMDYPTLRVRDVKELFAGLNGFFVPGRESYLLSRVDESDLKKRAHEFREVMAEAHDGRLTFGEVMEAICDKRARPQVKILIESLEISDQPVTPFRLSQLMFAVDKVTEIKHNEEIPQNEKTGVLIADCANSVFVDKPVVIYLGMEQDWNISVSGKKYLDVEAETEKNAMRLEALIQQGQRRVYCVNTTKNGKRARPSLLFDVIFGKEWEDIKKERDIVFGDVAPLVHGRWAVHDEPGSPERGAVVAGSTDGLEDRFSKSTFNDFYSCPRKYMFHKLLPTAEEKTTAFGTIVHEFAEAYFCHREEIRDMGIDRITAILSEHYSGLSTPLMGEIDSNSVKIAVTNVMRYVDMVLGDREPPLDVSNTMKTHPNKLLEALGLEKTSECCEQDHSSDLHPIHGEFDLIWDSVITDYKTGKGKTTDEIFEAMTPGSTKRYPEFQPLMYLAIGREENSGQEFRQLYVRDNDVESLSPDFNICRNVRTVRIRDTDLLGCIAESQQLRRDLITEFRTELKDKADTFVDAFVPVARGVETEKWNSDPVILSTVGAAVGVKPGKEQKDLVPALNKLCKHIKGGTLVTESSIEVPATVLDAFMETVDQLHSQAMSMILTDYPATPRADCRDCQYFQACTRNPEQIEDGGDGSE